MSDGGKVNPEIPIPSSSEISKPVTRRGFLKLFTGAVGTAAMSAIFGKAKTAEAQSVIVPLPGQKPVEPSKHQTDPATGYDPTLREAQLQENAKKGEIRASYAAKIEQIAASGEKVLAVHSKDIKPINTTVFEGSKTTYAIGTLEESPNKPWKPEIMVSAKDLNPETIEIASVLTAVEMARIMNQAYGGDFARTMEAVNSGIRNNLSPENRVKLGEFLDIRSYENGSKVEIDEFQGAGDVGEMNYTWAYGLLRCKSAEILKRLKSENLSPALKEGAATVFLTALKVTANRLSGPIPPRDLGFNEDHIKELAKIGGNKVAFKYSS